MNKHIRMWEEDIKKVGLSAHLNFGVRLGFADDIDEFFPFIEEMVEELAKEERYEEANNLKKQLELLKEDFKNEKH